MITFKAPHNVRTIALVLMMPISLVFNSCKKSESVYDARIASYLDECSRKAEKILQEDFKKGGVLLDRKRCSYIINKGLNFEDSIGVLESEIRVSNLGYGVNIRGKSGMQYSHDAIIRNSEK